MARLLRLFGYRQSGGPPSSQFWEMNNTGYWETNDGGGWEMNS